MSAHPFHDFMAAHFRRFHYRIISPQEARDKMASPDALVLDVRTPEEFSEGHILGAVNIPLAELKTNSSARLPDKAQTILIYCLSGARAKAASRILAGRDYKNVATFGGISQWPYQTVQD